MIRCGLIGVLAALTFQSMSVNAQSIAPETADLLRSGTGDWCYNPIAPLTITQKADYVDFAVAEARRQEATYGVPAPILAAMSIRESGYGRTRLALLSNNILSFKRPANPQWQFGRSTFVLWCQPANDRGNQYLMFGSKAAAFDYVAKVLTERHDLPYAAITKAFREKIKAGSDHKQAALAWLSGVASIYAQDKEYVPEVLKYVENPLNPGQPASPGQSLWDRAPAP